jgi:hypothetical protein
VSSPTSNPRGASPQNPSPDLTNSGNPDNANPSIATSSAGASSTPPAIKINGDNPAHVSVGETYNDLGATITGPQVDLNLGVRYFLNGALVSDIVLDTSAAATHTIIIDAPPLIPDYNSTTTLPSAEVASSTAQ